MNKKKTENIFLIRVRDSVGEINLSYFKTKEEAIKYCRMRNKGNSIKNSYYFFEEISPPRFFLN